MNTNIERVIPTSRGLTVCGLDIYQSGQGVLIQGGQEMLQGLFNWSQVGHVLMEVFTVLETRINRSHKTYTQSVIM